MYINSFVELSKITVASSSFQRICTSKAFPLGVIRGVITNPRHFLYTNRQSPTHNGSTSSTLCPVRFPIAFAEFRKIFAMAVRQSLLTVGRFYAERKRDVCTLIYVTNIKFASFIIC